MFGSDWPVLTLGSSYGRWLDTVAHMLARLSDEEAIDVMHRTAIQVYGLTPFQKESAKLDAFDTEPISRM